MHCSRVSMLLFIACNSLLSFTAKCPDLSDPDSGTLSMTTTGSITTASFTCQSGYYLSGAFILTCGTDELWSDDPPTCSMHFYCQTPFYCHTLCFINNIMIMSQLLARIFLNDKCRYEISCFLNKRKMNKIQCYINARNIQ